MLEPAPENFFLCFGLPKSGTTFLQRTLDLHPEVSCPSEHQLVTLSGQLDQLLDTYGQVITVVDRRTGGQGAKLPDREASLEILRSVVLILSRAADRGKRIHGLNDNAIFSSTEFADVLFGRPKMIAIIRNPVDLAISAWRHNKRLAREEPENAAAHLKLLDNPAGTLDGYVTRMSAGYRGSVMRFLDYAAGRPNVLIVRYEQLVASKKSELRRIFGFLGASAGDELLERIAAASSPAEMAGRSTNPAFFRPHDRQDADLLVSRSVRESVLRESWPALERAGYEFADLMGDHQATA